MKVSDQIEKPIATDVVSRVLNVALIALFGMAVWVFQDLKRDVDIIYNRISAISDLTARSDARIDNLTAKANATRNILLDKIECIAKK